MVSDYLRKDQPNCNLTMFGQSTICISISGDDSTNQNVNPDVYIAYNQHTLFHCFYSLGHTRHYVNWIARLIYTFWTLMCVQSWRQAILIYLCIRVRMLREQFKLLLQLLLKGCTIILLWILIEWIIRRVPLVQKELLSGAPEFTPGF